MTDKVTVNFGYVELVETKKVDPDGTIWLGGYAIHYDGQGNETHRTENTWNVSIKA